MNMRLSKEEEEMVLKNLGLVHYIVNKLKIPDSDYEDLVSIGTIGLIKAAKTFDSSKKIKFSTYAGKCINNEIFMNFRKEKFHKSNLYLDAPIAINHEGDEMTLGETIPNPDKDFTEKFEENEEFTRFISVVLNVLAKKERLIMLYKIASCTQKFIGDNLNVSQSWISRVEAQLQKKIKKCLTTTQQFKEVYCMAIVGDLYQISFSSKDISNFNKIFATFLQTLKSTKDLPDFRVDCTKERINIFVPAHPESFSFIAQIIQEIDNYSFSFKNNSVADTSNSQEIKTSTISEKDTMQKKDGVSDLTNQKTNSTTKSISQVQQIRDYFLNTDSFTTAELKQHFPNMTHATISNALTLAKAKGLIISTARGKYKVIQN